MFRIFGLKQRSKNTKQDLHAVKAHLRGTVIGICFNQIGLKIRDIVSNSVQGLDITAGNRVG